MKLRPISSQEVLFVAMWSLTLKYLKHGNVTEAITNTFDGLELPELLIFYCKNAARVKAQIFKTNFWKKLQATDS